MVGIARAQSERELQELQRRLSAGFTDKEIMKDLRLPEKTFYRYKAKLYKVYGRIAEKKTEEIIEHEAELLKERYIRLYRNLELRVTKPEDSDDLDAISAATEVAAMLATNIFRLEVEGLKARQTRMELRIAEQKATRYLGLAESQPAVEFEIGVPVSDITSTGAAVISSSDSTRDNQTDQSEESGRSDNQMQQ